ncbi:MAG: hypothetical protein WC120_00210 [Parcubacteria group bacterium]
MEKIPRFIKEFSKKESSEERNEAARAIKEKRANHFDKKNALTDESKKIKEVVGINDQKMSEQLELIQGLENTLVELSNSGLKKLMNYFHLKKLQADIAVGEKTFEELKQRQEVVNLQLQKTYVEVESQKRAPELEESKVILQSFYKGQNEKWAESDYLKEDIKKYFSEEHLASLSIEDYALLLRRFPGEMVTHVTRQGIRDHVGHIYHTAGDGAYSNGFMRMVDDGRLRSPLGLCLTEVEKEQSIAKYLNLAKYKDKNEALDVLNTITTEKQGEPGSFSDRMAIHFATEEVADCYYGSEKGNEIFIIFPSAHVASQYYFSGQSGSLNRSGGGYWNDQWVWANEERGMDLNAGLVFIPKEVRVNRITGSRYELDENKTPKQNRLFHSIIEKFTCLPDFHLIARQIMEITGKFTQELNISDISPSDQELYKKLKPLIDSLEKCGILDTRMQLLLLDYRNICSLDIYKDVEERGIREPIHTMDVVIGSVLKKGGILLSEAKDTCSSKEFWESYFAKNVGKKPNKIVYYEGSSPTYAFLKWRKEQNITKKTKDENIGFPDHHIQRDHAQAIAGMDRFRLLAEEVIEKYFAKKKRKK